jgi:TetR/AcrR family transcriptional repressor of nem operon
MPSALRKLAGKHKSGLDFIWMMSIIQISTTPEAPEAMRKSRIEAAETRQQIINVAASEFRLNGISATGLVPLMRQIGLTHGGFYRHFESKEQLVAEACSVAIEGLVDKFKAASSEGAGHSFMSIVDSYVSTDHRDNRANGCPLAGMGSELVRGDENTRQAASQGFNDLVDVLARSMDPDEPQEVRSQAVFAMAAMVGGLTLSRIISDPQASLAVLQDVRQHLNAF